MIFEGAGKFEQGVSDVDPVAAPETIILGHVLKTKKKYYNDQPQALYLALIGATAETVTLNLYFLIENLGVEALDSDYKNVNAVWFPFATSQVITVGTLTSITSGLPHYGRIYARRTADTIAASQTRTLLMDWAG